MTPAQLICRKRDGVELTNAEIHDFVQLYTNGDLPDYQMSALAMAIYFQGMTMQETTTLTRALLESGSTLTWDDSIPKVDKHSTGGIGDKISLVLAPMMACCGLHVPMLSGRGLGITGGTLDKLEAIPGFRTNLSLSELQRQALDVGCVVTGASEELAPADRKLYALRDVTGTVPSRPLIVASIMSKKLAEGLSSLVLDVKVGSGAVMKTVEEARLLANELVAVGKLMGVKTTALLTNMEQPLGHTIGNAVEVQESIDVLQGGGPADVLELSFRLGNELLVSEGVANNEKDAHQIQLATIMNGSAYEKFEQMVAGQGGANAAALKVAKSHDVLAEKSGYIHAIDSALLGNAVIQLGGGRRFVEDKIDHSVGFELQVKVGNPIAVGQPLTRVFTDSQFDATLLAEAFDIRDEPAPKQDLIIDRIT